MRFRNCAFMLTLLALVVPWALPAPAEEAAPAAAGGGADAEIEEIKKGLEADEANVDLHIRLANALMKKGNHVRAKEEIDFVSRKGKLTPELDEHLRTLNRLGRERFEAWKALSKAGDTNKAQAALFDAFNLNDNLAVERFKELKEATAFWKEQADKNPNGGTLFRAAYLCEKSGDVEKASEYYAMMLDHITDKVSLACVVDRAASLSAGGRASGRRTKEDIEREVEERCKGMDMTPEEKAEVRKYFEEQASFADRMDAAQTPEEKEAIMNEAVSSFKDRASSGTLPPAVQKMLDAEAKKSGKTVEQLIEEQSGKHGL